MSKLNKLNKVNCSADRTKKKRREETLKHENYIKNNKKGRLNVRISLKEKHNQET